MHLDIYADGPSQGFREHGNKGIYFKGTREIRSEKMRGTGAQRKFWGTGNIGNDDFDFGQQGTKQLSRSMTQQSK